MAKARPALSLFLALSVHGVTGGAWALEADGASDSEAREVADEPVEAASDEGTGAEAVVAAHRLQAWEAPRSCIEIEGLRRRVEGQLSVELDVDRKVHGEMIRGPAGWIVTLTVFESGERLGERLLELSGDDCRNHDETLALVIALLLENGPPPPPEPVDQKPPLESEPPPAPPPQEEEPESDAEPPPEQPQVTPLRYRGGMGIRTLSGWLPAGTLGPTAFFGAELFRSVAIDLVGDLYVPQSRSTDDLELRSSGGRVHLRACGLPRFGEFGLSICAGIGWRALSVRGEGVPDARSAFFSTPEGALSAAGTYHLNEHWAFEVGGEGSAPFSRGRFVVESPTGEIQVHRTDPIIFGAHVGVVLTL